MMERINADEGLQRRILFTDESTVQLYSTPNRQNLRIRKAYNPYRAIDVTSQWPQKVNVWCGLYGSVVLEPVFIEGNLRWAQYLEMLRERIVPQIRALEDNVIDF